MKIMVLADLHLLPVIGNTLFGLPDALDKEKPDVVLVAGDVVELYESMTYNPDGKYNMYRHLREIFEDVSKVVFCLGNHEFAYSSVAKVHETLRSYKAEYGEEDVVCLDTEGHADLRLTDGRVVRVVGNVLFYDGECSTLNPEKVKPYMDKVSKHWLDCKIVDFHPRQHFDDCVKQIKENLSLGGFVSSILLTHTVPHRDLNVHDLADWRSIYSGAGNLFAEHGILPDYAFCGHTHRPVKKEIVVGDKRIYSVNIGNDYCVYDPRLPLMYHTMEIN